MISIDPGGAHVGWARFDHGQCTQVRELTPAGSVRWAREQFADHDVVVIESFILYPHLAREQIGSDMPTSQLIGVLRYIANTNGCMVRLQPASIKKPTLSLLRHRGVELRSVKQRVGGHAKDAETHGYHYLIRRGK